MKDKSAIFSKEMKKNVKMLIIEQGGNK